MAGRYRKRSKWIVVLAAPLFFAVQGAGILVERSRFGRQIGLARGARGWLFTMLVLVLPAPILFHPPFVERVVIPLMHAMGAL